MKKVLSVLFNVVMLGGAIMSPILALPYLLIPVYLLICIVNLVTFGSALGWCIEPKKVEEMFSKRQTIAGHIKTVFSVATCGALLYGGFPVTALVMSFSLFGFYTLKYAMLT